MAARKRAKSSLSKNVKTGLNTGFQVDERFWQRDTEKREQEVVLSLIPDVKSNRDIINVTTHKIERPDGTKSKTIYCPRMFDENAVCKFCVANKKYKDSDNPRHKKLKAMMKWGIRCETNIYIHNDNKNPANNKTVKLLAYTQQLKKIINKQVDPPADILDSTKFIDISPFEPTAHPRLVMNYVPEKVTNGQKEYASWEASAFNKECYCLGNGTLKLDDEEMTKDEYYAEIDAHIERFEGLDIVNGEVVVDKDKSGYDIVDGKIVINKDKVGTLTEKEAAETVKRFTKASLILNETYDLDAIMAEYEEKCIAGYKDFVTKNADVLDDSFDFDGIPDNDKDGEPNEGTDLFDNNDNDGALDELGIDRGVDSNVDPVDESELNDSSESKKEEKTVDNVDKIDEIDDLIDDELM